MSRIFDSMTVVNKGMKAMRLYLVHPLQSNDALLGNVLLAVTGVLGMSCSTAFDITPQEITWDEGQYINARSVIGVWFENSQLQLAVKHSEVLEFV